LVIGGLGNFGMELAEFMATQYDARVFLTTRTPFPKPTDWDAWLAQKGSGHSISQKILALQELHRKGCRLEVLQADVCSPDQLTHVRDYIHNEYGAIAGVVHAAGIVESGMIQTKTIESFDHVFAAKVHGSRNVYEIFHGQDPDFIILCSSMNAIIGGLGQIDNTAANAFIDAYAEELDARGKTRVLAINWGAVNEARARNYATSPQFAELSREHIKNKMTKEEIFDVYRRLFSSTLGPRIVVSTIDFNEVIRNWSRVGSLKELVKQTQSQPRTLVHRDLPDEERPQSEMEQAIAGYWSTALGVDSVRRSDDFFELGGNSLLAIQFIGMLTREFPIRVHAMSIYEYPSLMAFAKYAEQLRQEADEKLEMMSVCS
ncbi:MAG: SDR family oxidoreductase, partial [Chlamydiia bacterium]|nr:SDR family oxidoreductase [Chlamydiia bacterium]